MDWTALVGQIPLVAAFIWFSLEQQKRFDAALDRRDEAFDKRNDKICEALDSLTSNFMAHDDRVREFFGRNDRRNEPRA